MSLDACVLDNQPGLVFLVIAMLQIFGKSLGHARSSPLNGISQHTNGTFFGRLILSKLVTVQRVFRFFPQKKRIHRYRPCSLFLECPNTPPPGQCSKVRDLFCKKLIRLPCSLFFEHATETQFGLRNIVRGAGWKGFHNNENETEKKVSADGWN